MKPSDEIGWREILHFLSPIGQQQMIDFVLKAKEERGKHWLPEIEKEFPTAFWIIDLVANKSETEAVDELKKLYPHFPIYLAENAIVATHRKLRFELERER